MGASGSSRRGMNPGEDERRSGSGRNSSRRARGDPNENPEPDEDGDLITLLSYLIRSGQVRIVNGTQMDDDDNELSDEEDDFIQTRHSPRLDEEPEPDTSVIDESDLKQEILLRSGNLNNSNDAKANANKNIHSLLYQREIAACGKKKSFMQSDYGYVASNFLPNSMTPVATYSHKAFCGTYSKEGNVFLSACQDSHIRIYDTSRGGFDLIKTIRARDVGWSILDVAFSPDGNHIVYSSWSEFIHLCNVYGEGNTHTALNLNPDDNRFCIFSLAFSRDGREILGGANDRCLYVYDRECDQRSLRIETHQDDVNAVAFADETSQILFSGGDDGLVKIWDRRTLSEHAPKPVGVLSGHADGITYIDSKGDGRYLISNSKDQTIKLWDIRRLSDDDGVCATKRAVERQQWDYRWQTCPRRKIRTGKIAGDASVMTYRGHDVLHTLIRCHFSPEFITGSRYIYTGCARGRVILYDILTGKIVKKLKGHDTCVRDVSWHPYEPILMSTSWDRRVGRWTYYSNPDLDADLDSGLPSDPNYDDDKNPPGPRRSARLRDQRQQQQRSGPVLLNIT